MTRCWQAPVGLSGCALQGVSTMATQPLEQIAEAGRQAPLLWFQLYVLKDREFVKRMVLSAPRLLLDLCLASVPALSCPCCFRIQRASPLSRAPDTCCALQRLRRQATMPSW